MAKKKAAKKPAGRARRKASASKARRAPATKGKKKAARKSAPDPEAMMAAWQAAMNPSAGHKRLEPLVGNWRTRTTMVMAPGTPPEVSEGRSEHRFVLGGRYLEQRYSGSANGMPFEGLGYTGYDNAQRKYVGSWMDTFGTGIMNSLGAGKPKDDHMEFDAHSVCPTGETMDFRCKVRIQDANHHTYEMWTKAPNGRNYRMMLVEYTRA